jgi:hypothetical protein
VSRFRTAFTLAALAIVGGPVLAQGFAFMPDGGRGLFLGVVGDDQAALARLEQLDLDQAGWMEELASSEMLSEREATTLAGYLSVNFPLPTVDVEADFAQRLPRDGKDLAIANCQTCHSIFSGYLTQRRTEQGWRSIFLSPFHREIEMSEAERETFALYSAANMPIAMEDVPPELRF